MLCTVAALSLAPRPFQIVFFQFIITLCRAFAGQGGHLLRPDVTDLGDGVGFDNELVAVGRGSADIIPEEFLLPCRLV